MLLEIGLQKGSGLEFLGNCYWRINKMLLMNKNEQGTPIFLLFNILLSFLEQKIFVSNQVM